MELWILFALIGPVFWALVNLIDTKVRHKHVTNDYVITAFWGFLFFFAFILVPFVGFSIPPWHILLLCLIAGMLLVYLVVPYFMALYVEETSRVVTLWFITPALLPFFALIFLGEVLTLNQYLGFFLVVAGGAIISIRKTADRKRKVSKALFLVLVSGMIFNGYVILLKYIYNNYNFWHAFLWTRVGLFIGALTLLVTKKNRMAFAKHFKRLTKKASSLIITGTTLDLVASISFTIAVALGPVSLVGGLTNFQPLFLLIFIVFLARYFPQLYKEEVSKSILGVKFLSIILMLVGLWLIGV